jgi:hypothetical protein
MKSAPYILAALSLAGLCLAQDITGRQDYSVDCANPPTAQRLLVRQATSQKLGWTFSQGTTRKDISAATSITFNYRLPGSTNIAVTAALVNTGSARPSLRRLATSSRRWPVAPSPATARSRAASGST